MPGPPRTPSNLKLIAGTDRKDRQVSGIELPTLSEIPEPVDWLPNSHAVTEWRRLAPILVNNRLLAEADLVAFGHMCSLHGKMVQLWAAGEAPTGYMISQYIALASAFGLSPAWRSKVKASGNKAAPNKFGELKKPKNPEKPESE